jgi:hypothetical protein
VTLEDRTPATDSKDSGSLGYRTDRDNNREHDKFVRLREHGQLQILKFQRGRLGTLQPCDSHILLFFLFNSSYKNGITYVSIESIARWANMSKKKTQESIKRLIENRCITKAGVANKGIRFKLNPCFYETRGGKFWAKQDEIFNYHSPIKEHHDLKGF